MSTRPTAVAILSATLMALSGACSGGGTVDAGAPMMLAMGAPDGPWDIAVDATDVYWTDLKARSVMKVSKPGSATIALASDQMGLQEMALDSMFVYWTSSSAVMKVPLAGGTPVAVAEQGAITDVAADAAGVYWTIAGTSVGASPSAVMKAARDTGAVTKLTAEPISSPLAIAIDATAVYWMTSGEPFALIEKVPLAGGAATQVVGEITPSSIASDGTNVYFTIDDVLNSPGAVMKVPVGGGTATRVASVGGQSLVVDGAMLYWAAHATIYRVSKNGGAVTAIPTGDDDINRLVVDATHLYWTSRAGRVMALAKP